MSVPLRVLVIEDSLDDTLLVIRELRRSNYDPSYKRVEDAESLRSSLTENIWDLIISDYILPKFSGLDALAIVRESKLDIPFIMISGKVGEEVVAAAMKLGASDYVLKDCIHKLSAVVDNELLEAESRRQGKIASQRLQESEKKFRDLKLLLESVINNIPFDIFALDNNEKYILQNSQCIEDWGDVIGKTPEEIAHSPETLNTWKDNNRRARNGETVRGEVSFLVKGERKSFYNIVAPLVDHIDLGIVGINIDVTNLKQTEEALRRSEGLFRSLSDFSPVGIFETDPGGKCIYLNDRLVEMTGLAREELLGYGWHKMIHPDDKYAFIELISEAAAEHRYFEGDFRELRPDGAISWLKARSAPIRDPFGNVTGRVGTINDITSQKKIDAMKDDFVSMVTHELRNPVAVIHEGISQLQDGLQGELNPGQKRLADTTLQNIQRLAKLISNILQTTRIEAGRMEISKELFNPVTIARDAVLIFKDEAAAKGLELKENYPAGNISAKLDPTKLGEIFTNLIGNAVKYTDTGSIEVSIVDRGDQVECIVADTGPGIAKEDLPMVFDKFKQFGRAAQAGKGTGLGLTITKALVELHGGRIWAESEPGRGSKFSFSIPKSDQSNG